MTIKNFTILAVAAAAASIAVSCKNGDNNGYPQPGENTISTTGSDTFSPATLTVDAGDVITFNVGSLHTATQVDKAVWDANGTTPLTGGFNFAPGTHTYTVQASDAGKTLWYVCQNHVSMGMKGRIVVSGEAAYTVSMSGLTFSPATLNAKVGDMVTFELAGSHTATQVDQAVWDANGTTPLSGGFRFTAGTSTYTIEASDAGTIYYVCEPHVASGMKGTIVVTAD